MPEPPASAPELSLLDVWPVRADTDRLWSAKRVMLVAERIGATQKARWEIGICMAELVSNAVKYAGGGTIELWYEEGRSALHLVVKDAGRGFPSVFPQGAMTALPDKPVPLAAVTTAPGLRIGLDSVRRLMDEVSLESRRNQGATVRAVKLLKPRR